MRLNKILVIVTSGIVLFGSLFAFIGFAIKRSDERKQARCTYEVTATVTANIYESSTDSDGKSSSAAHPVFEYTYNGAEYSIKSSSGSYPPVFSVGEEVKAYINEDKPEEIYVPADDTVKKVSTVFIVIGIIIAALGIIIPAAVAIAAGKMTAGAGDTVHDRYDDFGGADEYDDRPDYDEYDDLKNKRR